VTDEIRLTLPRDRDFFRIAHLVVGGLAVRLDLTFEHLEDLQLALAGLLDTLVTRIGPVDAKRLAGELGEDTEFGLARVLGTVADSYRLEGDEIELVKTVERVEA
jgi:hypothetical protein